MGGFGSGRSTYATTPTVGRSLEIDADSLTDAVDRPGSTARKRWGEEDDPTHELRIQFEGETTAGRAEYVRFEYDVSAGWTDHPTENDHRAALEYTEPHFGGARPWFRCPGVVDGDTCDRRVRKLYFPRGAKYWLCRECYDLGYLTARASGDAVKTAELRYRRAFAKADVEGRRPHPNNPPHRPERPKGMHHATFTELVEAVEAAREEWQEEMDRKMAGMVDRYQAIIDDPLGDSAL